MPKITSTPGSTISNDVRSPESHPVVHIEDSHFQLPIRRHPTLLSGTDEDSATHRNDAQGDTNSEITNRSDSGSSRVIFTPESGLSEDDEVDLDNLKEKITGSNRLIGREDLTFHGAVASGRVDLVKAYIDQGVSVDLKTKDDKTPLIIAILEAQLGMARVLLECGASIHRRANGRPPIVYAAMEGAPAPPFLQLLIDYGADPSTFHEPHHYNALHWAASTGNIDAVSFLVSTGMNTEQTCSQGRTPLLIAAANGKTAVTKLLLAKGAEATCRSHNGGTAVAWAACHGHADTIAYLLEEGLDFEDPDNSSISKSHHIACLYIQRNASSLSEKRRQRLQLGCFKITLNLAYLHQAHYGERAVWAP
jgi:ankyrin repeat protein